MPTALADARPRAHMRSSLTAPHLSPNGGQWPCPRAHHCSLAGVESTSSSPLQVFRVQCRCWWFQLPACPRLLAVACPNTRYYRYDYL